MVFQHLPLALPSIRPAAAAPAAIAVPTSTRATRTARISRSGFHVLGNHHANRVLPGGNVAETNARRFAAIFIVAAIILIVAIDIALVRGAGFLSIPLLGLGKIKFLVNHSVFFTGRLVPDTISPASATAAAATPSPLRRLIAGTVFPGILMRRDLDIEFQFLRGDGFIDVRLIIGLLSRRRFRRGSIFAAPLTSAATAAATPSSLFHGSLLAGGWLAGGLIRRFIAEFIGGIIHNVEGLLRFERFRLGRRRF